MGLRVLLVDADVQPSLSKYFPLADAQPAAGLTEVILRGEVTAACITATVFPNLDIVVSDDPEGNLPTGCSTGSTAASGCVSHCRLPSWRTPMTAS